MTLTMETIALKMLLKIPIFLMLYLPKSHAGITLKILRKTCQNTGFLRPVFKDILFVYKDRKFDSVFIRENTGVHRGYYSCAEAYLEPSRTSTVELFCKNSCVQKSCKSGAMPCLKMEA